MRNVNERVNGNKKFEVESVVIVAYGFLLITWKGMEIKINEKPVSPT